MNLSNSGYIRLITIAYENGRRDCRRNPTFNYKTRQYIQDEPQYAYELGFERELRAIQEEKQNA